MTQLVELQKKLPQLNAAGIKVFGISYDSVDILKDFSDDYSIGYDLLSDPDSAVIKQVGILNTLIEEDSDAELVGDKSMYGLPFPGVYVLDEEGRVIEKFFNRSFATRSSAGNILNAALGEILRPEEVPAVDFISDQIEFSAFLADEDLKLEYLSTLYVRFQVAEGLHIYADPLPRGFIATTVSVAETPGLTIGEPIYPPTQLMAFEALDVELPVYGGVVDVEIPITANAATINGSLGGPIESLDVAIDVHYQVCSDSFCYLPKTEHLTMTIPIAARIMPRPEVLNSFRELMQRRQ